MTINLGIAPVTVANAFGQGVVYYRENKASPWVALPGAHYGSEVPAYDPDDERAEEQQSYVVNMTVPSSSTALKQGWQVRLGEDGAPIYAVETPGRSANHGFNIYTLKRVTTTRRTHDRRAVR